MGDTMLDTSALGQMLREHRGALSLRQAAADAGVSFSTFTRAENGAQPDLASFQLLCAWLGVSPAKFFITSAEKPESALAESISLFRSDPRLSPANADRIAEMLTGLYEALAEPIANEEAVMAVHLRAAKTLRPGVPARLEALLDDIYAKLQLKLEAGEL